jgi:flagellar biosynthesis protein FlhG
MKGIQEQTYYEVLEVSPTATVKEIQKAYERAKETFHADSLAVYSLFTEQEILEIQAVIEEAYKVLMDEALRKSYDHSHFQTSGMKHWEKPSEVQIPPRVKKAPPSSVDISVNAGEAVYRGKTLRQIRERMGIDLEIIAQETKINLKTLKSIEDEALEKLPALVYLKGFLRGYAQSLGLDPQKVVEGYVQSVSAEKKKSSQ